MDKPPAEEILIDSLLSLGRGLKAVDTSGAVTLDAFDRISASAQSQNESFFDAADRVGETLTPEILSMVTEMLLLRFFSDGAAQLVNIRDYLLYLRGFDTASPSGKIFHSSLEAAAALARLHLGASTDCADTTNDAIHGFEQLAGHLEAAGNFADAMRCAQTVCNLIAQAGDARFLPAAERALRLALLAQDADAIGICSARVAFATAAAAEVGECSKLAAFDAIERAFMTLPANADLRQTALSWLERCLAAPMAVDSAFEPLVLFLKVLQSGGKLPSLTPEGGDPNLALQPSSDADPAHWVFSLRGVCPILGEIENARLALDTRQAPSGPSAAWETWTVISPALWRAVPQGTSILRDRNLDEMVLLLKHELTHVYSMVGNLVFAVMALRAICLDLEIKLWHFGKSDAPKTAEELLRVGVAPLREGDFVALAQAEQALEASRKLQITQDLWGPWFEGIALYAELADDPSADAVGESYASTVLRNLIDDPPVRNGSTGPEVDEEKVKASIRAAEQMYSGALSRRARSRLRRYIGPESHRRYFSGYLAARSIVSSWRETLGRPLSGAAASRILLHVTRFGTEEALPDLSLPLKSFRAQAEARLRAWLNTVARAKAEDLSLLESGDRVYQTNLAWVNGRLKSFDVGDNIPRSRAEDLQMRLVGEASRILCGHRADPSRISGANEETRQLLSFVAERLSQISPDSNLIDQFLDTSFRMMRALPLGATDAPFWLSHKCQAMFILIRTTETSRDTGRPRHDGLVVPLKDDEFAALEREIRCRQAHRMTVTRIADLISTPALDIAGTEPRRIPGANYVVFECGNFLKIQPRGMLFGSTRVNPDLANDIELRCRGNSLLAFEAKFVANGQAGARRTRDWIESVSTWEEISQPIDVGPWAQHVKRLAEEVLLPEPRPDWRTASLALIEFVLGDRKHAEAAHEQGLAAFFPASDPKVSMAAIQLLDVSGRSPAPLPADFTEESARSLFSPTAHGWDVTVPRGLDPVGGNLSLSS